MKITQTGRGQYKVTSRSQPNLPHTVDMEENCGVGKCDCEDHHFRCQPNYEECLRLGIDPFQFAGDYITFCAHKSEVWPVYTRELAIERSKLNHTEQI